MFLYFSPAINVIRLCRALCGPSGHHYCFILLISYSQPSHLTLLSRNLIPEGSGWAIPITFRLLMCHYYYYLFLFGSFPFVPIYKRKQYGYSVKIFQYKIDMWISICYNSNQDDKSQNFRKLLHAHMSFLVFSDIYDHIYLIFVCSISQ